MGKSRDKSAADNAASETPKDSANDPATASGAPAGPAVPGAGDDAQAPIEAHADPAADELPIVESPKLAGGESVPADAEPADESSPVDAAKEFATAGGRAQAIIPNEPAADAAAPASGARSFRFLLLAATIALAAGVGSFIGGMAVSGVAKRAPAEAAIPKSADARDVLQALKAQAAELTALKASIDSAKSSAGTQFAKIADRIDGLERAGADPATKLAHIAETVDRIAKREAAAPETTGSIASVPPSAPPPAAPPTAEPNLANQVLGGWVVQDVRNGRAMVENRFGGLFVVGSGSILPGLGRVEAVKRQDGEWVVVTARGVITSAR
jgi:hypothetical protein